MCFANAIARKIKVASIWKENFADKNYILAQVCFGQNLSYLIVQFTMSHKSSILTKKVNV